jgi:hypothetical protein
MEEKDKIIKKLSNEITSLKNNINEWEEEYQRK